MTEEKEFPSDRADKFVVRFPEGMRERIAEAAKANNRSMNAEIVARLEKSFSASYIAAPTLLRSINQHGEVTSRDSKALVAELASLIRQASHLADIFNAFQDEDAFPSDDALANLPEWAVGDEPLIDEDGQVASFRKKPVFVNTSRDVLLKPLGKIASVIEHQNKDKDGRPILGDNGKPSATPIIPGINAPKRGLGSAKVSARNAPKPKMVSHKKKVTE